MKWYWSILFLALAPWTAGPAIYGCATYPSKAVQAQREIAARKHEIADISRTRNLRQSELERLANCDDAAIEASRQAEQSYPKLDKIAWDALHRFRSLCSDIGDMGTPVSAIDGGSNDAR